MPVPFVPVTPADVLTLHRYFITADIMRGAFQSHIASLGWPQPESEFPRTFALMSLWYGSLYVAVDGWRSLRLPDPELRPLLRHPNLELLRGARNSTFHFQRAYVDIHYTTLVGTRDAVDWILELHRVLGEAILRQLAAHGQPSGPPE